MPFPRRLYGSLSLAALVAGFLVLALIVFASLWVANQVRRQAEVTIATQDSSVAANRLGALLERAETGRRGFLITGQARFGDVADKAAVEIEAPMAVLRNNNVRAGDLSFPEIEALVDKKLESIAQSLALVRGGRRDEASAAFLTDEGIEDLMRLRHALDGLVQSQAASLVANNAAVSRNAQRVETVTVVSVVVLLALALASVALIRSYTREIHGSRAELAQLNASLEAAVAERTADLTAANDEIQRFAYIVSHDLRAPLVNIMGFTSELEAGLPPVEKLLDAAKEAAPGLVTPETETTVRSDWPEAIGFIRSATAKMDRLINAILKLSREGRSVLAPERLDMTEVVSHVAATLKHQADETGAEIRIATLPEIVGDRLSVEQVFGNLLDNAVKYLLAGRRGVIDVTGRVISAAAVEFSVRDNGRGIAKRDLDRIFELFRRSGMQDQPGEGIGLAHVRPLVRRMGGTITCSSELGVGTEFQVVLPRVLKHEERE